MLSNTTGVRYVLKKYTFFDKVISNEPKKVFNFFFFFTIR